MSRSKQTFEVNSWTDVGVDAIQTPELNSDQRAKFVVIGAGYSGVAAARRLATLHPDSEIVLLESEWFGDGSSSRSSGFVVSLGQFERPGSPENQRCYRFGKTAIEVLRELVQHHQIDCDWMDQGRIVTCRCRSGAQSLDRMEHVLKKLGSPFEKLDGAAIHEETGMSGYVFGIRQADSVLVNPAKLLVGLVKALPSNVSVYQDASVRSLTRKSNGRGVLVEAAHHQHCIPRHDPGVERLVGAGLVCHGHQRPTGIRAVFCDAVPHGSLDKATVLGEYFA